mgnify:CR=1 FL=1
MQRRLCNGKAVPRFPDLMPLTLLITYPMNKIISRIENFCDRAVRKYCQCAFISYVTIITEAEPGTQNVKYGFLQMQKQEH